MSSETFKSSDLAVIVTLLCFSIEVIDVVRLDQKRVEFHFKNDDTVQALVNDFYNRKLLVEPSDYFQKMKEAKNRIFSVN